MELSIIIPAYNEQEAIGKVVEEIRKAMTAANVAHEIVVVDDGSRDGTVARAKEAGARVIEQVTNRGYGASIMTGIREARFDLVATIDADLSYSAWDLAKLLPFTDKFDLVVGLRTGKEYRGRLLKYPARVLFRQLAEYVAGERIPDINSGMRIFHKTVFLRLPTIHICRGFSFSTTMTLMFLAGGYNVHFIPIEYRSRQGKSKVRYLRDTLRALQILFEIATHYNPIKAVLPLVAVPAAGTLACLTVALLRYDVLWFFAALLSLYTAIVLFVMGMMLLQIRMSGQQ